MQLGDLIECNDTGSLGVITKIIDNKVHHSTYPQSYKVFWMLEATDTYVSPQDIKRIAFNSDGALDPRHYVITV